MHIGSDSLLAGLDSGVIGALGRGARLDRLGVGLELLADSSGTVSDSLGDHNNLIELLDSEAEPITDLGVEVLLGGQSVGDVKEGTGGGNDNAVLAQLLDGKFDLLDGGLEVGLPNVASIDHTAAQSLVGTESRDNSVELLRVADKVDVDAVKAVESRENINVVNNVTEVGGQGQAGALGSKAAQFFVGRLEGGLDLGSKVEDEDGLVDLDILSASSLQLGEKVNVERQKFLQLADGLKGLATVSLTESQEGHGTQNDGAGHNASLLGLQEVSDRLGVGSQLEDLVVLQGGLDVVY